jgi:hypothetical protein
VLDAEVVLNGVLLAATDAGRGGHGAPGQPGQPGGLAGSAPNHLCAGGEGGSGADGAPGGGGAGGVSAAALTLNGSVEWDRATTLSVGVPGEAGLGGLPGVNDGIKGLSRKELVLDAG